MRPVLGECPGAGNVEIQQQKHGGLAIMRDGRAARELPPMGPGRATTSATAMATPRT